jgi:hypothetical protein
VTTTTDLLADLRRLEQYAIAGGADDRWLGAAISRLTLLCMGVPLARVATLLRVQELRRSGISITTACRRVGLSRDAYYRLLQILRHHPRDTPSNSSSVGGSMPRIVKNANSTLSASDVAPVPVSGNGKPSWTPPAVPRAPGGMATGQTGGNYKADEIPNLQVAPGAKGSGSKA